MTDLPSVTDANFQQDVLDAETLVLVDFWAVWSGASRALVPHLRSLATTFEGQLRVVKLNVDDNTRTPLTYQIRSIPTLLLFKGGEVVDQMTGNPGSLEALSAFVMRHLGTPAPPG